MFVVIDVVVCGFDLFGVEFVVYVDMFKFVDIYLYCVGCVGRLGCVVFGVSLFIFRFEFAFEIMCFECEVKVLICCLVFIGECECVVVMGDLGVSVFMFEFESCESAFARRDDSFIVDYFVRFADDI